MLVTRLSGAQLHAARVLAGLTREDLAERAHLCRQSIAKWEGSSNATPDAMLGHLCRALDVLEAEGIRFTALGIERVGVTLASDGPPAMRAMVLNAEAAP